MIFAGILAGGIGSRMNIESMPKQFLPLCEKPVLVHTVEKFCTIQEFNTIVVGVHPDWIGYAEDLFKKYHLPVEKILVVGGGSNRNETIFNIATAIQLKHGDNPEDILVTHDSVRPFVTRSIIERNIAEAKCRDCVDTVIPATDTIVESQNGELISSIPDRAKMYQGQTPQSFRIADFLELYKTLNEFEKASITDACRVFSSRGKDVFLVRGSASNFKLTTPVDYKIAQAMMSNSLGES